MAVCSFAPSVRKMGGGTIDNPGLRCAQTWANSISPSGLLCPNVLLSLKNNLRNRAKPASEENSPTSRPEGATELAQVRAQRWPGGWETDHPPLNTSLDSSGLARGSAI